MRETIESIAIAFVLAFLFRTFEAEAFVIPTGSMAPTLYGRHKDVVCQRCGFSFAVGASDEVDEMGFLVSRIDTAVCPNCGYENPVRSLPVFKGDRILVNKFIYGFTRPKRWDVAVFKYPEEPKTNYIKRIVGLPNERIVIKRGDVYKRLKNGQLQILRKADPNKQDALQLIVYDNDHPETELFQKGWPRRWIACERVGEGQGFAADDDTVAGWKPTASGWKESKDHSFELASPAASDGRLHWLRYRHIVPSPRVWQAAESSATNLRQLFQPRPQLITDVCSYNSYTGGRGGQADRDCYWVRDLTLACRVRIKEVFQQADLFLELNEGCRQFRCHIDPATGKARLATRTCMNPDLEDEQTLATAVTKVRGPGSYDLKFANVDDRLCLWVNGRLVSFDTSTEYSVPETELPGPQEEDLIPVGIAARNVEVTVSRLRIYRDIYYRSEQLVGEDGHGFFAARPECDNEAELRSLLHDPQAWWEVYRSGMNIAEFQLGDDQYLMLGDNSPRSKDSRLWTNLRQAPHRYAVPAKALVGKAFFVYWPHGKPFLRGGKGIPISYHYTLGPGGKEKTNYPSFRIPFYPQVWRMHRIR